MLGFDATTKKSTFSDQVSFTLLLLLIKSMLVYQSRGIVVTTKQPNIFETSFLELVSFTLLLLLIKSMTVCQSRRIVVATYNQPDIFTHKQGPLEAA